MYGTSQLDGKTWGILTSIQDHNPINNVMTIARIKSGQGGMGTEACRWASIPIVRNTATEISLTGCSLELGLPYEVFIYTEDGDDHNGNDDGELTGPLRITVGSNDFREAPTVVEDSVAPDGDSFSLQYLARNDGHTWGELNIQHLWAISSLSYRVGLSFTGMLVESAVSQSVTSKEEFLQVYAASPQSSSMGRIGQSTCRWEDKEVKYGKRETHTLTGCVMEVAKAYHFLVYIETRSSVHISLV